MKVKYAVTFEFESQPPLTHRGEIEATTIGTCARRAIEAAQKVHAGVHWSSLNFVALERLPSTDRANGSTQGGENSPADDTLDLP